MAVFTLQSLVLRGVSVVRDGQNVGLRLGAECRTASATPEVRLNPRHPSHSWQRGFMPDAHAEYDRMAAAAALGAGRPHSCDGTVGRVTPTSKAAKRLSTDKRGAAGDAALAAAACASRVVG